jgi:hypothetical protein
MSAGPDPTPPGHEWRCNACTWRGHDLAAAKTHLIGNREPFGHMPFECLAGADDVMAKVATRVMLPHAEEPDRVVITTWQAARKRLYARLDPLVADLRARNGRLNAWKPAAQA